MLEKIKVVALDMDGTIYSGRTLFGFTRPFLQTLERLGIHYVFLTNNSSRSAADYVTHLREMGIDASPDQVYTSGLATIDFLEQTHPNLKSLYVLGTPSLRSEFEQAGFALSDEDDEPDAVVTGFDTGLEFSRLCRAAWWIKQGKPYFATHPDFVCPTDQPLVLVDCGAVSACLAAATGRQPDAVPGKPDPAMLAGILHRHGIDASQLAMCGDRLYTDMEMARRAGALGVLVLTGETTAEHAASANPAPDLVVPDLGEFGRMLERSRNPIA